MTSELERWIFFVLSTGLMAVATMWHVHQHREGRFRGHKWLGELMLGHQIVTDRDKNPRRFAIYKWVLGASLAGIWIGWFFVLRVMLQSD